LKRATELGSDAALGRKYLKSRNRIRFKMDRNQCFKNEKIVIPDGGKENFLEGLARLDHDGVAIDDLHHLTGKLPVLDNINRLRTDNVP